VIFIFVKWLNLSRICGSDYVGIQDLSIYLSLKRHADPGIPEVEDARKRLAGLRAE